MANSRLTVQDSTSLLLQGCVCPLTEGSMALSKRPIGRTMYLQIVQKGYRKRGHMREKGLYIPMDMNQLLFGM